MIEFPSPKQIKAIKKQQMSSTIASSFTATLELPPKNFVAQSTFYTPPEGVTKVFGVTGDIELPESLFRLSLQIPYGGEEGTSRVSTNPLDYSTVYAVYLAVEDGWPRFYIGRSGFVQYRYYPNEKRIEGSFEYVCVLNHNFKGQFNIST